MLLLLLACADAPPPAADSPAPSSEDCGDYASLGQPFLMTWCTSCHGPTQELGAVRLHTLELLQQHSERVQLRLEAGSMPPSGGPSEAELQAFQAWLDCGAPGLDPGRPADSELEHPSLSWEDEVEVSELGQGLLNFEFAEAQGTWRGYQVWELQEDGGLALAERGRRFEAGEISESFEPPLLLWHPIEEAWTQDTTRSRSGDLGVDSWQESWTVSRHDEVDVRALALDPLRGFEATTPEGSRARVLFSGEVWLSWSIEDPEVGDIAGQSQLFDNEAVEGWLGEGLIWQQRVVRWD